MFRNAIGEQICHAKYLHSGCEDWPSLSKVVTKDVCHGIIPDTQEKEIANFINKMFFIPAGRYLYYAGRPTHQWNNCLCLRLESDSREAVGRLLKNSYDCLSAGAGIGIDHSIARAEGEPLTRTGGTASGPLSHIMIIDKVAQHVIQGASRRAAVLGMLNSKHKDAKKFIHMKDADGSLSCTNISILIDDPKEIDSDIFKETLQNAVTTGEPGFVFSWNGEPLRNACSEVTSDTNMSVCNLGSVNMGRINSIEEFKQVVYDATLFLLCGSMRSDMPNEEARLARQCDRRVGVGLMGYHEWLIKKGYKYSVPPEAHEWLKVYKSETEKAAKVFRNLVGISAPKALRSIAPTGTISLIAGTSAGIEPIFSPAYRRTYLTSTGKHTEVCIDSIAKELMLDGVDIGKVESAFDIAPETRIEVQAQIQDYVDMAISSTVNLPKFNGEDTFYKIYASLRKNLMRLKGITFYPNGARSGQPIEPISMKEAAKARIEINDMCKDGICGI